MSARNNDQTQSTLPPVELVNKAGQVFSESSAGALAPGFFNALKQLNPGVGSRGLLAFDVPPGVYRVKLSGGLRSSAREEVELPSGAKAQGVSPANQSRSTEPAKTSQYPVEPDTNDQTSEPQ